jgi:FXSXX-COOH protein
MPDLCTDLADLRDVPLGEIPALPDDVLRRLIPAPAAGQVPVAAFNSSI